MEQKLGFIAFIQKYFPEYKIDDQNNTQISQVAAWVERDPNFANLGQHFHLDRGLLFMGGVGVGKTDLFRLINKYLREYIRSPYWFKYHVAWNYASEFASEGYKAFANIQDGNRYFDELCFCEEDGGIPTREYVNHFGNKLLIGTELIMCRYNAFKNYGLQTHFSTNATPAQLQSIYKERAFDRLVEMCNFIVFTGQSRRWEHNPNLHRNLNKPIQNYQTAPVSDSEHQQNMDAMDLEYHKFLETGKMSELAQIHYYILKSYKCDVGDEALLEKYAAEASETYFPTQNVIAKLDGDGYEFMSKTPSEKDADKRIHALKGAKTRCVYEFYMRLKEAGAKSIFKQVSVDAFFVSPSILK